MEKLEILKNWLTGNGYKFDENHVSKSCGGVNIPLRVFKPKIAVYVGSNDEFFQKVKRFYSPFFIRDTDSEEFVIEKISNCIRDYGKRKKNKQKKVEEPKAVTPKRKRTRIIKTEKVYGG